MEEKLHNIKEKIKELWEKTTKNKKIAFGVGVVLFLFLITFLIMKMTEVKYEVLYSDLSLKDMGEITERLDDMNIEWKVGEKDSSILVPAEKKNKVKIELATYGLPKEGYSYSEAFDESSWTMTDYDKKQRMKQALQSELSTTISEIDGIDSAKVFIDDKGESNFVLSNEDTRRTASVFVTKDPRVEVSNEKVIAIKNLVAGAINIDPEDVIVTNNDGRLLDGQADDGPVNGDYFAIKADIEDKINDSIRKFLSNIYGYANVDVLSSVKINMDSEQTTVVEFAPPVEGNEEGMIRSIEETEESMLGANFGGVAGFEENRGDEDYTMEEDDRERYTRASSIINNELNEINREIRKAPGQVESVTVAVLINEKSLPGGEMTLEKEEEITNLIYAATGLDTKQVKVIAEEFTGGPEVVDEKEGFEINWITGLIIALIIIAIIVGIYLFIRKKQEEEAAKELEAALLEETMRQEAMEKEAEELTFETEDSRMKKQIDNFIDNNPEAVTQLLRSWLNE